MIIYKYILLVKSQNRIFKKQNMLLRNHLTTPVNSDDKV